MPRDWKNLETMALAASVIETPNPEVRAAVLEDARCVASRAPLLYRLHGIWKAVETADGLRPPEGVPIERDLRRMFSLDAPAPVAVPPEVALDRFQEAHALRRELLALSSVALAAALGETPAATSLANTAPEGSDVLGRPDKPSVWTWRGSTHDALVELRERQGWRAVVRANPTHRTPDLVRAALAAGDAEIAAFAVETALRKGDPDRDELLELYRQTASRRPPAPADALGLEPPPIPPAPYVDELVAYAFVDAEQWEHRFHDVEAGLRELTVAARVADRRVAQIDARCLLTSRTPPSAPTAVDLCARIHARKANALRYNSRRDDAAREIKAAEIFRRRFRLGVEAEAEVLWFGAVIRCYTCGQQKAARQAEEATELYRSFDRHLGAVCLITKAQVQRSSGSAEAAISTLQRAMEDLDPARDPLNFEGARNNLLLSTLKTGELLDLEILRRQLPFPRLPLTLARRLLLEGCIELIHLRLDLSEHYLTEAFRRFKERKRWADAACCLLYLAVVALRRALPGVAEAQLQEAAAMLRTAGYADLSQAVEVEIGQLSVRGVLEIAEQAGGCLGPSEAPRLTT